MSKFIARAIYWVFAAISLWIFISKCSSGIPVLTFSIAVVAFCAVALLSAPLLKLFKKARQRVEGQSTAKMAFIIFAVSLLPRVLSSLLLKCDFSLQEDMAAPGSFVGQLLSSGVITENASYAQMYGRYVNTAFFIYPWAAVFGSSDLSISLFFNTAFSLCYVGWFCVLKRFKKPATAFLAVLAFSLLWTEVWLSVLPIHENVLFICISAFAWIYFDLLPRLKSTVSKSVAAVFGAVLFAIGISCNSMGYVAAAAFGLYAVAKALRGGFKLRRLACAALSLLIFVGLVLAVVNGLSALRGEVIEIPEGDSRREGKVPYGWSVFVGFNYESNGKWTEADYVKYYPTEALVPEDELYDYQARLLNERLQRYKESPTDALKLFNRKVYEGFGGYNYGIRRCLQYTQNEGAIMLYDKAFSVVKAVFHVISMILHGFLLLTFSKKKQDELTPSIWLKAFFCGVFLILMVVEILPKYAVCMWALLFLITVIDSDVLAQRAYAVGCRFKRKEKHNRINITE